jgi:hypothetical protein
MGSLRCRLIVLFVPYALIHPFFTLYHDECFDGKFHFTPSQSFLMSRPVRSLTLTAKLKDTSNTSTPELSFQRKAVQDFHAARQGQASAASLTASEAGPLSARGSFTGSHISLSTASTPHKKRSAPSVPDGSDEEDRGMF